MPWYSIPGNHDLSLGTPNRESGDRAPFEAVYGPSTFAFHAGPALFIGLDDVRPLGGPRYTGGLLEAQFQFVGNLLRDVAALGMGCPHDAHPHVFAGPGRNRGLPRGGPPEAFQPPRRGALGFCVLSGHTHYQRHVVYGAADGWAGAAPLHDYNVAAACGGFWGGPKDAEGIPASTMWDGTPPGYAVVGFSGDKVSLDYFPARMPADRQIALHAPAVIAPRQGYVSYYANVFNGHAGWSVEARVDDRVWHRMPKILGWDPSYAAAYLEQDASYIPVPGKRLPDPAVCYHLWRGSFPADLPLGRHVLQVRAADPSGHTFTAEQPFEIANP